MTRLGIGAVFPLLPFGERLAHVDRELRDELIERRATELREWLEQQKAGKR